jgi:hypothetical protein
MATAAAAAQRRQAAGKPGDRAAATAVADQSGGGGGSMAMVAAVGRQRWMRGGSIGRAAEAAWQPGGTNFFWLPSPPRINLEEPISSGYPAHLGLIRFSVCLSVCLSVRVKRVE